MSKVILVLAIATAFAQAQRPPSTAIQPTLQQKLIHAVVQDQVEAVQQLLAKGGDPNGRSAPAPEDAWAFENTSVKDPTPPLLVVASRYGSIQGPKIIQMLLDKGAKVNVADRNGVTPLMVSAELGMGGFSLLLEHGAKVNVADSNGKTPLMYAMNNRGYGTVSALLEHGAKINARDKEGETALMYAIRAAQHDPIRLIGDDQKKKELESQERYVELIKLLIDKGADVNARDSSGETALAFAQRMKRQEIVELLRKAGAKG
jgi:ankyrin repeat protein